MLYRLLIFPSSVCIGIKKYSSSFRLFNNVACDGARFDDPLLGSFFSACEWQYAQRYWESMVLLPFDILPSFVKGDKYGVANLSAVHEVGQRGEFSCKHTRYVRKRTYAMTIGYIGSKYNGYQYQPEENIPTVERFIYQAIGKRKSSVAGRTDKGVSAISQVVSFPVKDSSTSDELLRQVREASVFQSGHVKLHDIYQVPRSCNARAAATWRRYLYLIPLPSQNSTNDAGVSTARSYISSETNKANVLPVSLDIEYLDRILKRLENKPLPYNAYAVTVDRTVGIGLKDVCTMMRARAFEVNIGTPENVSKRAICVELVGTRFLRRMVRKIVATAVRASLRGDSSSGDSNNHPSITGTSSSLGGAADDDNVLVDICNSGDRSLTAPTFPSEALCMAGVGFDLEQLAKYKFMKTKQDTHISTIDSSVHMSK